MAASVGMDPANPAGVVPNETLDQANDLGILDGGTDLLASGSIGGGPAAGSDVEWYRVTFDHTVRITAVLASEPDDPTFRGVISLYNDDPFDFMDLYNPTGHRLLGQAEGEGTDGVATLTRDLGPGTYFLAVSGAGNTAFHPIVAGSGLPGLTGDFDLRLVVEDAAPGGPIVVSREPADSAVLDRSPLAIRLGLSGPIDPWSVWADMNVQLISNPSGTFGDGNDVPVPLSSVNFAGPINELQLFPMAPLAPGYYQVVLSGRSDTGLPFLATLDGSPLGMDEAHPNGQDFSYGFRVDGIEGRPADDPLADDTAPGAHELGDVTDSGVIRVAGTVGDDPFYNIANAPDPFSFDPLYNPGNDVDLYRFRIEGPGRYALVAEVFAGRIGSPLDAGLSLFRLDPTDGTLHFVAGNNDSRNPTTSTDGFRTPLYSDPILFQSLEAGEYYLAVAGGFNTPSPEEGLPPGSFGLFDVNVSHSGQMGWSTGDYQLSLLVHASTTAPKVLEVTPADEGQLTGSPTHVVVTFDKPVNLTALALQGFLGNGESTTDAVFIEAADGTRYYPRLESYDLSSNQATFVMIDGLPDGEYVLHLSGPLGLTDLAGNPLVGNDPSGEYLTHFSVTGSRRDAEGHLPPIVNLEPNDDLESAQDLGLLFPGDLKGGVEIHREAATDPSQAPADTADFYRFEVTTSRRLNISLTGDALPPGLSLELTDPSGQGVGMQAILGGKVLLGQLEPGSYVLKVGGWESEASAELAYRVAITLFASFDNAPPLFTGPAPAVAIRLDSVAPPTPTPTPEPSPAPYPLPYPIDNAPTPGPSNDPGGLDDSPTPTPTPTPDTTPSPTDPWTTPGGSGLLGGTSGGSSSGGGLATGGAGSSNAGTPYGPALPSSSLIDVEPSGGLDQNNGSSSPVDLSDLASGPIGGARGSENSSSGLGFLAQNPARVDLSPAMTGQGQAGGLSSGGSLSSLDEGGASPQNAQAIPFSTTDGLSAILGAHATGIILIPFRSEGESEEPAPNSEDSEGEEADQGEAEGAVDAVEPEADPAEQLQGEATSEVERRSPEPDHVEWTADRPTVADPRPTDPPSHQAEVGAAAEAPAAGPNELAADENQGSDGEQAPRVAAWLLPVTMSVSGLTALAFARLRSHPSPPMDRGRLKARPVSPTTRIRV